MTYFDDQFEAWEENNCQGDPSDYEADEVADLLIDKEERIQKERKKVKNYKFTYQRMRILIFLIDVGLILIVAAILFYFYKLGRKSKKIK